jgi:hypothetical protein
MLGFMVMRDGWQNYAGQWMGPGAGFVLGLGAFALFAAFVWSIYWKGRALWQTARKGDKVWFVAFLVVNTLGILEILYLYVFSKKADPIK